MTLLVEILNHAVDKEINVIEYVDHITVIRPKEARSFYVYEKHDLTVQEGNFYPPVDIPSSSIK